MTSVDTATAFGYRGPLSQKMNLTVRDVARLFAVSEKTIYRWVSQKKLPAYRVQDQYRFNRAELLEWASAQRVQVAPEIFAEPEGAGGPPASLAFALRRGGIHYRLSGSDKASAIAAMVEVMPLPKGVDRSFLLKVLLGREELQSTAIGGGIAIPHPRSPILLHVEQPMVALGFLERAVEFGALDGKPVFALFSVVSPSARGHLQLLARLAFALRTETFCSLIQRQAPREEILGEAERLDRLLNAQDRQPEGVSL